MNPPINPVRRAQSFYIVVTEDAEGKWIPLDWSKTGLKEAQLSRLQAGRYSYDEDCFAFVDQAKELVFDLINMDENLNKKFQIQHIVREIKVISEIVDEKVTIIGTISRT